MIQPVIIRAFFVTSSALLFVQPTNVVRSFLHPTSFHDQLPRHMSVLVCPRFSWLASQHRLDWLPPPLRPSTPDTCALLPTSSSRPSWLASEAYLSRPAGRPPSCPLPAAQRTTQSVQVTGLAHDGSCHSSHLPPRLHFRDLLPPRLLLLSSPFTHPDPFRPSKMWPSWKVILQLLDCSLP